MLTFKNEISEDFLGDVIRDSGRLARMETGDNYYNHPRGQLAFSVWMKAHALGITTMLDCQVQHFAYSYAMYLHADDGDLDVWGIDPNNRAEAFPYYQAAA
jgi:hypothetical protein